MYFFCDSRTPFAWTTFNMRCSEITNNCLRIAMFNSRSHLILMCDKLNFHVFHSYFSAGIWFSVLIPFVAWWLFCMTNQFCVHFERWCSNNYDDRVAPHIRSDQFQYHKFCHSFRSHFSFIRCGKKTLSHHSMKCKRTFFWIVPNKNRDSSILQTIQCKTIKMVCICIRASHHLVSMSRASKPHEPKKILQLNNKISDAFERQPMRAMI